MKQLIAALATGFIIAASSCTPSPGPTPTPPVTPTPTISLTYSITLNGHTYNRTLSQGVSVGVGALPGNCQVQIDITDANHVRAWFWGDKPDTVNKVGIYTVVADYIKDWGDHDIIYKFKPGSTISVTMYTPHQIKGTFSLNAKADTDTTTQSITGSFDYNY